MTGRVTVLLEFPSTANDLRILTAATTRVPAGVGFQHKTCVWTCQHYFFAFKHVLQ